MPTNPKRLILPVADALLLALAWILAYTFKFEFAIPSDDSLVVGNNYALQLKLLLPWIVLSHLALYWAFRLYRGILKYSGSYEAKAIAAACGIHLAGVILLNLILNASSQFGNLPQRELVDGSVEVLRIPWSIVLVYPVLAALLTAALRFSPRLLAEHAGRASGAREGEAPATLIVGAGDVADSLLRRGAPGLRPICAVTEVVSRVGLRLHGVPVVALIDKIARVIEENQIQLVLIALDDPTPDRLRRIVDACDQAGAAFRIVPSMKQISEGRVEVSAVRNVEIEDLLGREQVKLELSSERRQYLEGNTILITGAGGSIGAEIARQAASAGAARLLLLGKGENSVFEIAEELSRHFPGVETEVLVADIRDAPRLERLFAHYRPTIIFHAAAHKHVSLMESAPGEAFANNVVGTYHVARMADLFGCRRFVLISTDKAVRPVSVMGVTKRLAEQVVFALARRSNCQFVAVRFGNVLGSRGSVIPLFRRQILDGGPVTVTHPDASRYFMTIPEAVSLVLQAGSREETARLYLLDMGERIRIGDLARNMITLSGLRPDIDIRIAHIGLRPGEKLVEDLTLDQEKASPTDIAKLLLADPPDVPSWDDMVALVDELQALAAAGFDTKLMSRICEIVPDYAPSELAGGRTLEAEADESKTAKSETPPDDRGRGTEEPPGALKKGATVDFVESDIFDNDDEEPPEQVLVSGEETPAPLEESIPQRDEPAAESVEEDSDGPQKLDDEPLDLLADDAVAAGEAGDTAALEEAVETDSGPVVDESDLDQEDLLDALEAESAPEPSPLDFPVEPSAEEKQTAPPGSAGDFDHAAKEEREPEPIMTQWTTDPSAGGCLLLRVLPAVQAPMLEMMIKQLTDEVLGANDKLVCLVDEETAGLLPGGVASVSSAGRPEGAAIAEAVALAASNGFFITTSTEVIFRPGAIAAFTKALAAGAPLAFSNFEEDKGGDRQLVEPHDHEGCPHERFEYGSVIAYSADAIRAVGGVRKDLSFAWEYDLHLKLMELAPFKTIRETLYDHILPVIKDASGSAVYSPGKGPLGGFSYVFYPQDMEKEVTSVFEEALKRRGAWIDHPTVPVDHGDRKYDVMVTVVTPILNRVKFIGNAIEKLQANTFTNWEMIIVDNGSNDGTVEKVKSYAAKDQRIRLIHGTGGTIASALNEGIKAARGKYIGQMDSDDEYTPECLEEMVKKLESNPKCGLAISYYRLMDADGKVIEDIDPVTHSGYSRNQILRRDGAGATRYFPRAVLEEFGYYDEEHYGNFGEDYDMVVKVGEKYDVERVHKVLYHYRRHSDNTDVTRDPVMKYKNKNRARQEALRRRIEINKKLGKA